VQDVAFLAPLDVLQACLDGRFRVGRIGVEALLQVPTARSMIVGDDVRGVGAEQNLGSGELWAECRPQRFIGVVDRADLVEGRARPKRVVAEVRSLLEVPHVPGEPVVVVRRKERGARTLVADDEPTPDQK
jgi:hypothetical protein